MKTALIFNQPAQVDVATASELGPTDAASLERRRIWQLRAAMHCSVLGTCLTLNDLTMIARKARYVLEPNTTGYALHSWFVDMMDEPNGLSKLVDKELEKRHGKLGQAVRRAKTEDEIVARWKELVARGHVASAYWVAMSHPLCDDQMQWRFFGEIHMLSHVLGASRREDVCRLHELEGAYAALDGKLVQLKQEHRASLREHKGLADALEAKGAALRKAERRRLAAEERVAVLEEQTRSAELEGRATALEVELARITARLAATERELLETRARVTDVEIAKDAATAHLLELRSENEALEAELEQSQRCPFADGGADADESPCLRGKRLLCVGGRPNLVQHYRAIVERRGGELLHHDGGMEDSMDAVTRALHTVDAVLCPIDCVSHAASLKVKRACKNLAKPFVPLRSSGLSSFARGVQSLAPPPR